MRRLALLFLLTSSAIGQLVATNSSYTLTPVRTGLPLVRMEPGVDGRGVVYAQRTGTSIFSSQEPCYYADPSTWLAPGQLTGVANAGQSILDTDGSCLYVGHWTGALEHNIINRVSAPASSATYLYDLLFGIAHGFTRDPAGNYYVGRSAGLAPAGIYSLAAGQLGTAVETLWSTGVGANAYLAWSGNSIVVADGASLWRVTATGAPVAIYTHTVSVPGATFEWRGLVKSPFGSGFAFSVVETTTTSISIERVLTVDGSGTVTELVAGVPTGTPSVGLSADHGGGLLVTSDGGVHRIRDAVGTVTFPVSARVAPGQTRPVVFTAATHPNGIFIPLLSCMPGETPLAGSPEPIHIAADSCTLFHLQDPSSPQFFQLAGTPGAFFGFLNAGGIGTGTVSIPASVPLGLDIHIHVTFLTVGAGGITGSHGAATFHVD